MKKHIQIKNSFKIWKPSEMGFIIYVRLHPHRAAYFAPYIIEWWLHNIGYYVTKPFTFIPFIKSINLRCKDVDLMVKVEGSGK